MAVSITEERFNPRRFSESIRVQQRDPRALRDQLDADVVRAGEARVVLQGVKLDPSELRATRLNRSVPTRVIDHDHSRWPDGLPTEGSQALTEQLAAIVVDDDDCETNGLVGLGAQRLRKGAPSLTSRRVWRGAELRATE